MTKSIAHKVYFGIEHGRMLAAYVLDGKWNYASRRLPSRSESDFWKTYNSLNYAVGSKLNKLIICEDFRGQGITPLSESSIVKKYIQKVKKWNLECLERRRDMRGR